MEKKKKKDVEATMPAPLVLPTEESISESLPTSRPASSRTTLTEAPEEDLEETPVEELPQDEEMAEDGENIEDEAAEDMEEEPPAEDDDAPAEDDDMMEDMD